MRNKLHFTALIIVSLLLLNCSNTQKLNEQLTQIAENLNKSTPVLLDDHTVFLNASVTDDNIFQYKYQIVNTTDPQSLMQEKESQTLVNIKVAFRINPDLRVFTKNNVIIDYIYTDSIGQVIKTIRITPKDYK